jgi:hypothetical protein
LLVAYTQNQGKQPPAPTLNKVKDDLYEIEGDGGNVAVYVTGEGVILVDDKFEQDHENIVVTTHPSLRSQRRQRQVHLHGRDHLDRQCARQHRGTQTARRAGEYDPGAGRVYR